jgi:hypothetical protein
VKAANTIGEAINDRIESMFGMLDRWVFFYILTGFIYYICTSNDLE